MKTVNLSISHFYLYLSLSLTHTHTHTHTHIFSHYTFLSLTFFSLFLFHSLFHKHTYNFTFQENVDIVYWMKTVHMSRPGIFLDEDNLSFIFRNLFRSRIKYIFSITFALGHVFDH